MIRGIGKTRISLQDNQLQNYFTNNADQGINDLHKESAYYFNNSIYIAYADVTNQLVWVMAYDTIRAKWSDRVNVGTIFAVDGHRVPSILVDSSGYIHIFYDCHTSRLHYIKSTYPEDISQWSTDVVITDFATYPQVFEVPNGDLYLFYRGETGVGGGHDADWVYRISTDSGATWGAEIHILDGWVDPDEHGFYATMNQTISAKEDIYVGFQFYDGTAPAGRYNAYYMYYDYSASQWKNAAGVNITGLLPLTLAQANANTLVRNSGANETTCARGRKIFLNEADECQSVVYSENVAGNWEYKYADWKLGAWNIYNVGVSGVDAGDNCCLAEEVIGANLYIYAEEGTSVEKWKSVNLGVAWAKERDIVLLNGKNPQMVRNNAIDNYVILGTAQLFLYQHTLDDFIKNFMELYPYTFAGVDQENLIQVIPNRILDTDGILVMDDGTKKIIVKGYDYNISLPIKYVEACHNSALEIFLHRLIAWQKVIKCTPHQDRWFMTHNVILRNSEQFLRSIHEIREDCNLEMTLEKLDTFMD